MRKHGRKRDIKWDELGWATQRAVWLEYERVRGVQTTGRFDRMKGGGRAESVLESDAEYVTWDSPEGERTRPGSWASARNAGEVDGCI